MEMMKAYGKLLSEVRLETNWGMSVDENPFDYKILNFLGNLENFLYWPNFPCVVPKCSVFSLSGKLITKFLVYPVL